MKIKIILFLTVLLLITYLYLFTGGKKFNPQESPKDIVYYNTITLPLAKFQKGFFTHTVYARSSWRPDADQLALKIDYISHSVTFENVDTWNRKLKLLQPKLKTNLMTSYKYFTLDDPGFWRDLEENPINYRIMEQGEAIKQIIVDTNRQYVILRL